MFYAWLSTAYAVLLCSALWLNRKNLRMLVLTAAVGAGIFVPVPYEATPALWYMKCVLVELAVAAAASLLRARASSAILLWSGLLTLMHLVGVFVGPQSGVGPYRIIIPILETAELITCLLLSDSVWSKIHPTQESTSCRQ
jgi:hypothetical protein